MTNTKPLSIEHLVQVASAKTTVEVWIGGCMVALNPAQAEFLAEILKTAADNASRCDTSVNWAPSLVGKPSMLHSALEDAVRHEQASRWSDN